MAGLVPPLPLPPDENDRGDDCRLWVGNLDTRITEFALLKLLQKFGELKKFDFLYHKSGPDQGKPRGYCFASYHSREQASKAIEGLNGKLALSKKLIVRWAHADKSEQTDAKPDVRPTVPCKTEPTLSKESRIRMIEAKLKMMESSNTDFTLTSDDIDSTAGPCSSSEKTVRNGNTQKTGTCVSKPYSRHVGGQSSKSSNR